MIREFEHLPTVIAFLWNYMTQFILILSCRMILGLPNDALYRTEFYLGASVV
jgi:hypothetical protein